MWRLTGWMDGWIHSVDGLEQLHQRALFLLVVPPKHSDWVSLMSVTEDQKLSLSLSAFL